MSLLHDYVPVVENENSEDGTEVPTEYDGTILLSTLQSQFSASVGLKYRSPSGKAWREVRCVEKKLHPPRGGWGETVYITVNVNRKVPPLTRSQKRRIKRLKG